jgi:repressor LexA
MSNTMSALSKTEERILNLVQNTDPGPTLREIAAHCGFESSRAAGYHLERLKRKGRLQSTPGKARSLRVVSLLEKFREQVVDIPVFGSIPAGFADERKQEAKGCVSIDIGTLGITPTRRTFALEVRGDSMIGKHILEGDTVIVEADQTPRNGDVVAALIDGESTLKTYVADKNKPYLRAENPRFPKLIPTRELVIQGVMIALIRKRK